MPSIIDGAGAAPSTATTRAGCISGACGCDAFAAQPLSTIKKLARAIIAPQ
ncbi:hypothetical protein A7982_13211 [Minicystis rosea]|nr:hypothetical protein A7982_13211 [Minicystis rosea]